VSVAGPLELLDWKRRVLALYAAVRDEPEPERAWTLWRETRDRLYRTHPQSPLEPESRAAFAGLDYFDYDPALRLSARLSAASERVDELPVSTGEPIRFRRFATVELTLDGGPRSLEVFWLEAYGGGRYLLDTVKGADLGERDGRLVLDFNFAYNPSCVYSARWACPRAPPANRLDVPIRAGERIWRA
jgi:uncharacterized protein (DUF1684 family)